MLCAGIGLKFMPGLEGTGRNFHKYIDSKQYVIYHKCTIHLVYIDKCDVQEDLK